MNDFVLKPLILRPVKSNISGNLSCYAIIKITAKKVINFSSVNLFLNENQNYILLMLCQKDKLYHFNLSFNKKEEVITLPKELNTSDFNPLAFAVVSTSEKELSPILFNSYQINNIKLNEILNLYAQNIKKTKTSDTEANSSIQNLQKASEQVNENRSLNLASCLYDDEAIAEENYYELYNKENNEKLFEQTNLSNGCDKQEPQEKEIPTSPSRYENSPCENTCENCKIDNNFEPTFYLSVKEKIDALFEKYPPFTPLNQLINKGKWVKIPYGNNNFYVVGVVYENLIPQYLVYGVPGYKSQKPHGFERYSAFIPESICQADERGFWCILQSAQTGEQLSP